MLNRPSMPTLGKSMLVIAAVVYLALYAWNHFKPAPQQINKWQPVQQIKEVIKIKRVTVPGPERIVTVEKEKVIEKLKLPDEVAKAPDVQVIATADVAPHRAKTDVVATLNTQTGEAAIISRPRKLPFFAFIDEGEVGMRYGIATNGNAADIYGRWDFMRIAGANIGVYAEALQGSRPAIKAQINISYKW